MTVNYPTSFHSRNRLFAFAAVGHGLELYDHTIYGAMIPFLASRFFPADDPFTSLFLAFLSFTLAFIISPMGSLFWGWYSDKFGRLPMLRSTMLIMALPALGIAMLPTYDTIGWWAPVCLVLFRMMQTMSASGEIIGARIFVMESFDQNQNGLASGLTTAIGAVGVLLAMGMGYLCTCFQEWDNVWRVPFLLGSGLFIAGQLIRNRLAETSLVLENEPPLVAQFSPNIKETFTIVKQHPASSWIVFSLGALLGIMSYTLHAFMNPYLIYHDFSKTAVYQYSIIGLVCTMVFAILSGYCADQSRRVQRLLLAVMVAYSVSCVPLFGMISMGGWHTLIAYATLAGLLGAYVCLSGVVMYRAFLPPIRCRGILFNYALGCATFGSLTPLTLNTLSQCHPDLPGVALAIVGALFLWIVQKCLAELKYQRSPLGYRS